MALPDIYSVSASQQQYATLYGMMTSDLQQIVVFTSGSNPAAGTISAPAAYQNEIDSLMALSAGDVKQAGLVAYAANARWLRQIGGIVLNGQNFLTDADSRGLINGAYSRALGCVVSDTTMPDASFKAPGGVWIDAPQSLILALGNAVEEFYQDCYSAERAIDGKIVSGVYATQADVDNASDWPSNVVTVQQPSTSGSAS